MRDQADQLDDSTARVRVLVALGINTHSQSLLQTAARLAHGLNGDLIALHIAPGGQAASLYQTNLNWHLDQARELGAEVEIVEGEDIAATLVQQALSRRVTHLVVGQSDVSRWREITRGSVINRMMRMILSQRRHIDLYIVTASSRD